MIWNFISGIYDFILALFNACENIWNYSFKIGNLTLEFKDLITYSLIVIIGMILIKKLIPLT